MYDTWEYAHSRLKETIVRKDGIPVYIIEVGPSMTVHYCFLNSPDNHTCKVKDLDLEPVPLGFFNTPLGAIYCSRQPKREDWRQGLRDNTLNLRPKRSYRVHHSNLLEAINGVNMPVQQAISKSAKTGLMIAYHRYWAVEQGTLYHKWRAVGTISSDGTPTFSARFEYLYSRYVEDCGDGNN